MRKNFRNSEQLVGRVDCNEMSLGDSNIIFLSLFQRTGAHDDDDDEGNVWNVRRERGRAEKREETPLIELYSQMWKHFIIT